MKKIIAVLLCVVMCVSLLPFMVSAETRNTSFEHELAETLRDLGLFKGVSETNFALDRAPTRIESLVMLIRTLGKESEALSGDYSHPFTDVPAWADKYVGYAYQTKLTNGVSADKFGSGDANAAMYLTFVLRSLGYSDANGEDFTWNDPYSLAEEIKILPENVDRENFWRADVATVSYAALNAKLKDSDETLAEKLIGVGAIDEERYSELYDSEKINDYFGIIKNGTSSEPEQTDVTRTNPVEPEESIFVLNNNTKKIHYPDCDSVPDIYEENLGYTDDPNSYINIGYKWCKKCMDRHSWDFLD